MRKFNPTKVKLFAMAAFAMIANAAVAQNLKVTRGGQPVANGDVIELKWEYEEDSMPEWDLYTYIYKWDPHLEAATDEGSASLTVTVTSLDNTAGFQLCWPGGCKEVNPNASASASGTITTEPQDLNIHKAFEFEDPSLRPTDGGLISVRISSGAETVEVTVKALLDGVDSGVGENLTENSLKSTYFTLQGLQVAEPQKGQLYIERKGGKTIKRIF